MPNDSSRNAAGRARLFVLLQHLLPQHALSRLVGAAARSRSPRLGRLLTRLFLRLYRVNLAEAAEPDPLAYPSFNAFFTRALAPGRRPIAAGADSVASPVDGRFSELGSIDEDRLLQAKGRDYTLGELLAGRDWASRFEGGRFATIYLAPHDYHRIHMPLDGRLVETVFVPGRLYSVNAATAAGVPRLFARNERVLTLFESAAGRFALVMVGALNVGSMATVWSGDIRVRGARAPVRLADAAVSLRKGDELGRFNLGSTVILLFEKGRIEFAAEAAAGRVVRMGEAIGRLLA
ncbi:MAG: phosphatidylserine decarboxylase [Gammaproteobacteria bacterium]|nr:phosphatidylserine decarboxylase [Gammaproteobacteria bacterium]